MKTKSKFLRILSLVSALAVLVACNTLFPSVSAEETSNVWDGSISTSFDGEGTAESPYLIKNGADLKLLLSQCTREADLDKIIAGTNKKLYTQGKFYKLTNDIYLNDVSDEKWYEKTGPNFWDSGEYFTAGTIAQNPFLGTLDGDGHTINGIYYKGDSAWAGSLLPSVANGAVIKNLIIANSYIESTSADNNTAVSALVAHTHNGYSSTADAKKKAAIAAATTDEEKTAAKKMSINIAYEVPVRIEKCYVADSVILKAEYCAGGLVGKVTNHLNIENCLSKANISAESKAQVNPANEQGYQTGAFIGLVTYNADPDMLNINIKTSLALNEPGLFPLTTFYSKVCHIDFVYMIENQEYWNNKADDTPGNYTNVQYRELLASVKEIKNVDLIKGDKAKDTLAGFDFDNTWQTVQGGTPVLMFTKSEINKHATAYVYKGSETATAYANGTVAFGANFEAIKAYLAEKNITEVAEVGFVYSTGYQLKISKSELDFDAVNKKNAAKAFKADVSTESLTDNLYCILKSPFVENDSVSGAYLTTELCARAYVKYNFDGTEYIVYADRASAIAQDLLNNLNK